MLAAGLGCSSGSGGTTADPGPPGTTAPSAGPDPSGTKKVLFVRGADGTTGFLDRKAGSPNPDENVSDVGNGSLGASNHGFADLSELLLGKGFTVTQIEEQAGGKPVDLAAADLSSFSVVVFGSNNAPYSQADAERLVRYVRDGGSVFFMADANWGADWRKASDSDTALAAPFGLQMNQDNGNPGDVLQADALLQPDHPILAGVKEIRGNGTSAITVSNPPAGASVIPLVKAKAPVRRNQGDGSQPGSTVVAGPNDFALVAVTLGKGRVAALFDRDTFFNANGGDGKTNLSDPGNKQLAQNLFTWLDNGT